MIFKLIVGKGVLWTKKHSPEILLGLGIGGMIAGTALACRATYKKTAPRKAIHDAKMDELATDIAEGKKTEEEALEIATVESRGYVVDTVKAYAIPVTVEAAGIACILASNHIMRKRVASITVAFTTVSTAFEAYRERVRERYGKDIDQSILLGEKQVKVKKIDENGEEKEETVTVADPDISSIGRYITSDNDNWSNSDSFMEMFFDAQQAMLTDKLNGIGYGNRGGFIILNDIYDALGLKQDTEEGVTIGKVYERGGDNQIIINRYKTQIPDEFGNMRDAWYVDFPGLYIIYGNKAALHRSIVN